MMKKFACCTVEFAGFDWMLADFGVGAWVDHFGILWRKDKRRARSQLVASDTLADTMHFRYEVLQVRCACACFM